MLKRLHRRGSCREMEGHLEGERGRNGSLDVFIQRTLVDTSVYVKELHTVRVRDAIETYSRSEEVVVGAMLK